MRSSAPQFGLLCGLLFGFGCPSAPPAPTPFAAPAPSAAASLGCGDGLDGSAIVARLGDVQVSQADVDAAIASVPIRARERYTRIPAQQKLALRVAEERLLCRAASAEGVLDQAAAARAAEGAIAGAFVDRAQIMAISDAAVAEYHAANADKYMLEVVDASHIIVETEAQALALERELRAGASFVNVAMEHSMDTRSAAAGGKVGWLARGRLDPAWTEAAFALKPGETSPPVKTSYGWALIHVAARKNTQPLDEVRPGIERRLREAAAADLLARVTGGQAILYEGPLAVAPTQDAGTEDPTP